MALQITDIKKVSGKSRTHDVEERAGGYAVTSGASGQKYFVRLSPVASCTCKWAEYHEPGMPVACSHVMAARQFVAQKNGYRAKFRQIDEAVDHLHRKTERIGNGVQLTLRKV